MKRSRSNDIHVGYHPFSSSHRRKASSRGAGRPEWPKVSAPALPRRRPLSRKRPARWSPRCDTTSALVDVIGVFSGIRAGYPSMTQQQRTIPPQGRRGGATRRTRRGDRDHFNTCTCSLRHFLAPACLPIYQSINLSTNAIYQRPPKALVYKRSLVRAIRDTISLDRVHAMKLFRARLHTHVWKNHLSIFGEGDT